MLLKEYDEEFHISCEKKISYEDGYEDGVKKEKARADQAEARADQAEARADQAEARAEQEKERAEQEKAQAEQEKARADQAETRADEANLKTEILSFRLRGHSEEEIAATLNIPINVVKECVRKATGESE